MHGEPIEAVKNGVQTLLTTLKQILMHWKLHMSLSLLSTLLLVRPYLLQISSVSISSFSASGTTALGEALSLTANRIDSEVQKTTAETKGDWSSSFS